MLINLTNHPYTTWDEKQRTAAGVYGECVDMTFPNIDPQMDEADVSHLADEYAGRIVQMGAGCELTVHVMGEFTFCYSLIRRLQNAGVRCVASCTERDVTIAEDGSKATKFHFARFREYVLPDSKKNKNIMTTDDKKSSLKISDNVSIGVLIALAVLDVAMLLALQSAKFCVIPILFDYAVFIVCIWLIAKAVAGLPLAGFSSVIFTKLLGNAIAPSRLGVAYLLVFVIHLGWLTDSTFNIISVGSQGIDAKYLVPLVCSIGGLMCIVGFFPDPYKKKNDEASTVIVSGMSLIGAYSWKKLAAALENNDIEEVKKTSLIPLVRMLVLHNVDERCRLLILKSDKQTKDVLSPININEHSETSTVTFTPEDQKRMEALKSEIITATTYLRQEETNGERAGRKALYEKYDVEFLSGSASPSQEYDNFMILLIKMFANFEFPDKFKLIKNLKVEFTPLCNYDNYADCFGKLDHAIQKYDDDAHEIEFNITPGTALVSSVMTLLAIDGDKKLYYHEQSNDKKTASLAIQEVDKTKLPIENLLSQALEKVSGKKS